MIDIVAFITARLDEDEQWALAASAPYRYAVEGATVPAGGVHWTWVVGENWTPVTADPAVDDTVGGPEHYGCPVNLASVEQWPTASRPDRPMRRTVATEMVEVDSSAAGHIARHDPARVLCEVGAKRRMLGELLDQIHGDEAQLSNEFGGGFRESSDLLLRLLAAPYSGHPDFREEWRP